MEKNFKFKKTPGCVNILDILPPRIYGKPVDPRIPLNIRSKMKIEVTYNDGEKFTLDTFDDLDIEGMGEIFKKILHVMGYHPDNVKDLFNEENCEDDCEDNNYEDN